MTIIEQILVLLHFIGWGALLGAMLVQLREPTKKVLPWMRDGIGLAFVAGLLLVGVLEAGTEAVNHAKVGTKFAIGLIILVLVMANSRKKQIPDGLFFGILGLTLTNMVLAIFWH